MSDHGFSEGSRKPEHRIAENSRRLSSLRQIGRRLSSLRQTIKRWDTRAKAKGYDTIVEALDAAPFKTPPTTS